jgi:uncharacterized protein YbjT (DUF2867 family)
MSRTLLVAGASGALGRFVCGLAAERGWTVRAMVRDAARAPRGVSAVVADARDVAAVSRAVDGCDAVFSCVGASVMPELGRGWRGFGAVDWPCNRNLIDAARAARIDRFVYVSVFHHADMRRLAYVDAHERVVDHLRGSGLGFGVVRPTGFHSAVASYVDLARKGPVPEIARGTVRTNPIADEDLAAVCADALGSRDRALEVACGGPEVVSRHEIAELAFATIGRRVRVRNLPAGFVRAAAWLGRPFHPRITQFLQFLAAISTVDLIAPPTGKRQLRDAFAARAASFQHAA